MEKSNLAYTLRTFDKQEIRAFRKWLSSPAHNQRPDVVDLFEYLVAGNHLFSQKFLAKEKAYAQICPGRAYNDAEMRQVMHFLFKAIEDFLVYNELLKDEVRSKTILAKVYRKRQLNKLFQKAVKSGQKIQAKLPYRNHHFYENEFALQFEQYSYLSGLGRNVPLNLQEVSDANDVAYLAHKLQLSCIMLSHQAVFKTEYRMDMLEDVLHHVEQSPRLLKIPAIAVYYHQFKAMRNMEDEAHYWQLKEGILKYGKHFPADELRVIYLLTINYCIGKINAGVSSFVRESFELYKNGLEKELFLENGILSRFTFNNAVTAALNLKEFDWVKKFIKSYSPLLEEKHRENFVHFNEARLFYETRNYGEAMRLFAQSDYNDILMTLNAKTMLLKMYYELDEYNALDSLLSSMRTYLQRKKVMGYHKTNYKNIISSTKKLLKIRPYDKEEREQLKAELEQTNPLTEKKWLLEQLGRL